MPSNNTISRWHQVLPAPCHVTLLTFHVMVFVKCSPFSISQACSVHSPIQLCSYPGPGEPAAGLANVTPSGGQGAESLSLGIIYSICCWWNQSVLCLLFCLCLKKRKSFSKSAPATSSLHVSICYWCVLAVEEVWGVWASVSVCSPFEVATHWPLCTFKTPLLSTLR